MDDPFRESNPGPPASEAGIMPLDQTDTIALKLKLHIFLFNHALIRIYTENHIIIILCHGVHIINRINIKSYDNHTYLLH